MLFSSIPPHLLTQFQTHLSSSAHKLNEFYLHQFSIVSNSQVATHTAKYTIFIFDTQIELK